MDDAARNSFKNELNYLVNFDRDQTELINRFRENVNSQDINNRFVIFETFEPGLAVFPNLAQLILSAFDSINFGPEELINRIRHFTSNIDDFRYYFTLSSASLRDLKNAVSHLSNTIQNLKTIIEIINLSFKFDYTWSVTPFADVELGKYESRGVIISSDPGFIGSPIEMLENFVLDRVRYVREYIGSDYIHLDEDTFAKLFFAIITPSMTGKTQSAFTFRSIRCLYFLLSEKTSQLIYQNFEKLSKAFREFVSSDYIKFKTARGLSDESEEIYYEMSSSMLMQNYGDTKFKTLGFIYALIEHANDKFDPNDGVSWMRFFATSKRSFTFEAKSLEEFKNIDIGNGNYVMFFDEFEATKENAFVRNLFRTAFAPVFAANTNSNAANLVGKNISIGSRLGDAYAWSLAAIMLNSINENILRQMYPRIFDRASRIVENAANNRERELIRSFFHNFFNQQLKHLRPGCADIIAAKIDQIFTTNRVTLNELLETFVDALFSKMVENKPEIKREIEGILGSQALFINNAFLAHNISHRTLLAKLSHMKSYIQYHYYYLINPVNVKKWCFLTYKPSRGERELRVLTKNRGFIKWDLEYTYFKAEEIFPFFACQAITTSISISAALKKGLRISDASAYATGRTPNLSQNVPLNGDELEVITSICIIEASHHEVGSKKSTFTGQNGVYFLTNLIGNLIKDDNYRRTSKVILDSTIIKGALKTIVVPFLFPANLNLPKFFKDNFSNCQGFSRRSVNFGEYKRTRNSVEIDGIFKYFIKNTGTDPTFGVCTVECKNWANNLLAADIVRILRKALNASAKLSLIICNFIGNSQDNTLKSFAAFCVEKNILVLKLRRVAIKRNWMGKKKFELVPYCQGLPAERIAVMTCIILELSIINPEEDYHLTQIQNEMSNLSL